MWYNEVHFVLHIKLMHNLKSTFSITVLDVVGNLNQYLCFMSLYAWWFMYRWEYNESSTNVNLRLYSPDGRAAPANDSDDTRVHSRHVTHWAVALLCPPPPRPLGRGIKRWCASDVCLSVAYIVTKSRTEKPRKTKIGTEVGHVTCDSDTAFKVKRSKVNLQGAGAYCGGLPHSLL